MQTHPFLDGIESVARQSGVDADFRKLALTDPLAALQKVTGMEIPAGARVRFVEEIDELVVVLPPLQGGGQGELSEENLASIQGGHVYWTNINILTDRTAKGEKMTHEECLEDSRNSLPDWLRNIFG